MDEEERNLKWKKYREDIMEENGIVVFMTGNKKVEDKNMVSDGCLKEFEIAKEKNCSIIPIGSTGGAAEVIYNEMKKNKDDYPYLDKYFEILGTEVDVDKIVDVVIEIAKEKRLVK